MPQYIPDLFAEEAAEDSDLTAHEIHDKVLYPVWDHVCNVGDEVHERATAAFDDPVIEFDPEHVTLYVEPGEWDTIQSSTELTDEQLAIAKSIHRKAAMYRGADEDRLDEVDALVIPHPNIPKYERAGLSPAEAVVQVLRDQGKTQQDIADRRGVEVGTIKSQCYRIDKKIEKAQELIDLRKEIHNDG